MTDKPKNEDAAALARLKPLKHRRPKPRGKNPHAVALGRLGGQHSGGRRPGAGRKRAGDRCPCGAMTAERAKQRNHKCEPALGRRTR